MHSQQYNRYILKERSYTNLNYEASVHILDTKGVSILLTRSGEELVLKAEVRQIKTGNQAQTTEALLLQWCNSTSTFGDTTM